jgi:hypothetical protein
MKSILHNKKRLFTYLLPVITGLFLAGLLLIALQRYHRDSKKIINLLTAQTVSELVEIFKRIDTTCNIISFEHEKNYIDFLTVKDFVGSEVGAMNLAHPEQWEGPYLGDNPTIQEKYLIVLNTPKGYYIAPGDGVTLANGKVIGVDIILNQNSDIEALIADENLLLFQGKPLIQKFKDK